MLYFGAPDDVVASDPSRASRGPPFVSPPRGWPGCFSSNKALKSFLGGKQALGGKRVRLTEEPSASDLAAVAEVDLMLVDELQPDDPFGNAERVRDALGWEVRKGFAVLELEAAPGEAWVAHRRWWNAAPEASGEKWVDFTPRPAGLETLVLVESARGDKQPAPPTPRSRGGGAADSRSAGWWLPRRWRRRRSRRSRRSRRRRRASRGRSRRARRRSSRSAGTRRSASW